MLNAQKCLQSMIRCQQSRCQMSLFHSNRHRHFATKVDRTGQVLPATGNSKQQLQQQNASSSVPSRHRPKKSQLSAPLNAAKKAYNQQQQQLQKALTAEKASQASDTTTTTAQNVVKLPQATQNIQQLMKMLLLINQQAQDSQDTQDSQASQALAQDHQDHQETQAFPNQKAPNTFPPLPNQPNNISNLSNMMPMMPNNMMSPEEHTLQVMQDDYMTTCHFFRSVLTYRHWHLLPVIGYDSEEAKRAHFATRAKLRIFSHVSLFQHYKNGRFLDRDIKPCSFTDLSHFIQCLLWNEQLKKSSETTSVEEKRELKEKIARHELAYEISHVPGQVSSIVIDDLSDHAFVLRNSLFETLLLWHRILRVESAIHTIRLWKLLSSAQKNEGEKNQDEKLATLEEKKKGNHNKNKKRRGKQAKVEQLFDTSAYLGSSDVMVREDPLQVLLTFEKYLLIKRRETGGYLLVPETSSSFDDNEEVKNTHVAVFTAPDLANQFVDSHELGRDQIKTVSGERLFKMLNRAYDRIGGIVINAGHLLPSAINQEVTFTRDWVRALAELQEEMEQEGEDGENGRQEKK